MAIAKTTDSTFTNERLIPFLEKKLLLHAAYTLRWYDISKKGELKKGSNAKTIRWFRRREASAANVKAISEGANPEARGGHPVLQAAEATLAQYGDVYSLTDVMDAIDAYEPLKNEIGAMGEDAGLKVDTVIRDVVVAALLNSDNSLSRFAGVNTGDSSADFTTLAAATNGATYQFSRAFALGMKTALRVKRAPKVDGKYYAGLIPPEHSHDFVQDTEWMNPSDYSKPEQRWAGEIGQMDGIRWIEIDNSFKESSTYGTFDAAGDVFSSFVVGRDAVGVPKMGGTNDPVKPKVFILDKEEKSDPLNLQIMAGWKVWWAAKVLNASFVCQGRALSSFA